MPIDASHIARKQIGPSIFVGFCMYMCEGEGEHAREGKIRELGKNWVESVQGLQVDS